MKYLSVAQCAKKICSSPNYILKCIKDKKLKAIKHKQKTRKVWRINVNEFNAFCKKYDVLNNKRIGRELFCREVKRNPYLSKGYRYIYSPHHPRCNHQGYVAEHVLIMEQHIGRYLTKSECVHHINHVRSDNDINNLKLYSSKSAHMKDAHSYLLKLALSQLNNE